MILLDTHVWVWWVSQHSSLTEGLEKAIQSHQTSGLGVSIISCWEVAKLVERGRLHLSQPVDDWLHVAVSYPGVQLIDLSLPIIVDSTQLPPPFHRDPADQLIVATSRHLGIQLLTQDELILRYPHVQCLSSP